MRKSNPTRAKTKNMFAPYDEPFLSVKHEKNIQNSLYIYQITNTGYAYSPDPYISMGLGKLHASFTIIAHTVQQIQFSPLFNVYIT